MAVRERAALGVLAGEPDRDPVLEQAARTRAPRPGPSRSPPSSIASRRRSSCLSSFGWTVKPSGTSSSCSLSVAQPLGRDGGVDDVARVGAGRARPWRGRGWAIDALQRARARPAAPPAPARRRASASPRSTTPSSTSRAAYCSRDGRLLLRSARPSAAACRPPRPARCGRSAGSRRGRRRRRGRTRCRYASASRTAAIAASGSSALTWTIGTSKPFARSLE